MTAAEPGRGMATLYPFLYADSGDLDAVMAQVRESTVQKVDEIVALRASLPAHFGERLLRCAEALAGCLRAGGRLFTFGNGGSSSDAQAVASTFCHPGAGFRPLPAFALTSDVAVLTALSNDVSFEVVFARQLAAFGREGDVAVGLSTSGGSANVLAGFDEARKRGLVTVGFAGYDGGRMADSGAIDHLFVVPSGSVHRIQEAQTTTYHLLWELTQQALSG